MPNYQYPEMLEQVLKELEGDPAMLAIALKYPTITKWWAMRKEKVEKATAKAARDALKPKKQKKLPTPTPTPRVQLSPTWTIDAAVKDIMSKYRYI